jgi:DNA-binding CsgD family transcriptional regulator/sugar-specific transcriptional regulator TrmB
MLEPLGLDIVTENVYRSLLEQPAWGVAEICAHLGLTESAVRDALDRLTALRLVTATGPGGTIRPVQPRLGLIALLARTEANLIDRQRQIEVARAAVTALASEYQAESPTLGSVEVIEGLDAVRNRLQSLAQSAAHECLSFMPGGAQKPDTMEASKTLDQLALERGVAVRSIYQESFRNDPATLRYVQWLATLGGETRIVPTLPMQLVIVDREFALVPLDPSDGRRGALALRGPGMIAAICALFDQFWREGVPWGQQPRRGQHDLTALEHELLWLLAQGMTDEVAARRLGLSLRTVRRMASELMARLNAHSRFEAGVRAVHRGWL